MLMIANKYNIYAVITIASLGNWLGGLSCYFLGYLGNWKLIEKYLKIKKEEDTKAEKAEEAKKIAEQKAEEMRRKEEEAHRIELARIKAENEERRKREE